MHIGQHFTPFHLVYGQEALAPIEMDVPSVEFLKKVNRNPKVVFKDRLLTLHRLDLDQDVAVDRFIQSSHRRLRKSLMLC